MAEIAIFDLDYTLTKRGTWARFVIRNVLYKPWLWIPLGFFTACAQWQYKKDKIDRISVKQAMMRWSMVGQSRSSMERLAENFAAKEVKSGLRLGAIKALEHHRDAGHMIIIASAAVDIIVAPIAKRLGITHWVATDMKWDNDKLAPEFASPNCYGSEKLRRVKKLLNDNPELKQNNTVITMYTDSYSDLEILRFSDNGVAVNADRDLREAAKGENFEIVEW